MKLLFTKNYCYLTLCLVLFLSGCTLPKPIKGAVVSAREEASAIGVAIMKQGGTAFDAMIATDLALTVCYPNAGNISGGGFFMYRTAAGEVGSLDYREKAPLGASSDMYLFYRVCSLIQFYAFRLFIKLHMQIRECGL